MDSRKNNRKDRGAESLGLCHTEERMSDELVLNAKVEGKKRGEEE